VIGRDRRHHGLTTSTVNHVQALIDRARTDDLADVTAHLTAMARQYPAVAARMMTVALLLADNDTVIEAAYRHMDLPPELLEVADRKAHSTYFRGVRTPAVLWGRARYKRLYNARVRAAKRQQQPESAA
jgi:hypothetical protein